MLSPPSSSHSPFLLLLAASPSGRTSRAHPRPAAQAVLMLSQPCSFFQPPLPCFPPCFTEITGRPKGSLGTGNLPRHPPILQVGLSPRPRIHHCPHGGHSTLDTSSGFIFAHSRGGEIAAVQPPVLWSPSAINSREGTQALNALRPAFLKSCPRPVPCHPERPVSEPPAGSHLQAHGVDMGLAAHRGGAA